MKKVYFAGSIRGGRVDADLYKRMIEHMQKTPVEDVIARYANVKGSKDFIASPGVHRAGSGSAGGAEDAECLRIRHQAF